MKTRVIAVICVLAVFMSGCASMEEVWTGKTKTGTGIGAVAGGVLGALIDDNKPWRGAIIGAVAGAAAGGWIGHTMESKSTEAAVVSADKDIVDQAAREAVKSNATVKYSRTTSQGVDEDVIARPGTKSGNKQPVTIEYYRDGKLVSSETREMTIL